MDFLVSVEGINFNVKARGFKELSKKLNWLVFGFNISSRFDVKLNDSLENKGKFRITFPKKYDRLTYEKLANVLKFYIENN